MIKYNINPYEVMGISHTATMRDIRRAYGILSKKYHPDVNKDPEAHEIMIRVNQAYELIKNESRRAAFDAEAGFMKAVAPPPVDTVNAQQRGKDVSISIDLFTSELVSGCVKEVKVERPYVCPSCHGAGTVIGTFVSDAKCEDCNGTGWRTSTDTITIEVPAGIEDGNCFRVMGSGGAPKVPNGIRGDLIVTVNDIGDYGTSLDDGDLHVEASVPWFSIVGGTGVKVAMPGGRTFLLPNDKVSEMKFTATCKVPGQGKLKSDGSNGDLYIDMVAKFSTLRTEEQRKAFLAFVETLRPKKPSSGVSKMDMGK